MSTVGPFIPVITNPRERRQARDAVSKQVENTSAGQGATVIDPVFLSEGLQQKFSNRADDHFRVPVGVESKHGYRVLKYGAGRKAPTDRLSRRDISEMGLPPGSLTGLTAGGGMLAFFLVPHSVPTATVLVFSFLALVLAMGPDGLLLLLRSKREREYDQLREQYGFSETERAELLASSITVPGDAPEMILAAVARECAEQVTSAEAWTDPILDDHRFRFRPAGEAEQVRRHAMRIAALRISLGDTSNAADDYHVKGAQRDIARLLESLQDRVAALWAYAEKIDNLSEPIRQLRTVRASIETLPAIDSVARQMGLDEIAVCEMKELTADADRIAKTVEVLAAELDGTLVPDSLA